MFLEKKLCTCAFVLFSFVLVITPWTSLADGSLPMNARLCRRFCELHRSDDFLYNDISMHYVFFTGSCRVPCSNDAQAVLHKPSNNRVPPVKGFETKGVGGALAPPTAGRTGHCFQTKDGHAVRVSGKPNRRPTIRAAELLRCAREVTDRGFDGYACVVCRMFGWLLFVCTSVRSVGRSVVPH